jgi:hypothetical protein
MSRRRTLLWSAGILARMSAKRVPARARCERFADKDVRAPVDALVKSAVKVPSGFAVITIGLRYNRSSSDVPRMAFAY